MPLHIVRNDIANMRTDAVVLPANPSLIIDGGAGAAVARIAGKASLQAACDELSGCPVGKAVMTPAFDFPAKMLIHAVGPVWKGGRSGEEEALRSCVAEALRVATEAGAQTVALPLLATGAFGFPAGEAIDIETRAIESFLKDHEIDIWLVLYDRASVREGRALFKDIEEYIDDVYVGDHDLGMRSILAAPLPMAAESVLDVRAPLRSLADKLSHLDKSFAATVLQLIDERGMSDVEVYKRANMSRQLFSKIRKDDDYRPTKKTACALAFALGLNHEDALDLLERAGYTLSHSSKFDVIIEYFLIHGIHDIFQVNEALFAYDQPILG